MTDVLDRTAAAATVEGTVAPGFEAVADAFRVNFAERGEVGASVCVMHEGRTVVDLWGGVADKASGRPWKQDTVSIVFSCTKGAAALCLHMLAERGLVRYEDPVERYWPAFAQNGKAGTTVEMMLAHTAPVPHYRQPLKALAYCDYDHMVELTEREEAFWAPGSRQGYHAVTYAWTVGHLVRLIAGQPLGAFFREQVAGPLGLDFHIGLPEDHHGRVAPMIAPDSSEVNFQSKFTQALMGEPGSLPQLFMTNNGGFDFNAPAALMAEIGSANGVTNGRGLAGLYAPLAQGGGGFVSEDRLHRMRRAVACTHDDATLRQPMRFGLGYMNSIDNRAAGADSVVLGEFGFGHVGMGGSLGFADPEANLSFGYSMNRMGAGILLNARGQSLVDAAYRSLGYRSSESGAWRR
jgi:CubicO group peptidase (beta-lactamase class C family)